MSLIIAMKSWPLSVSLYSHLTGNVFASMLFVIRSRLSISLSLAESIFGVIPGIVFLISEYLIGFSFPL